MEEMILQGGTVADPSQGIAGRYDILVQNGIILAIGKDMATHGRRVVNVSGRILIPGLVDLHTHLREPGGEAKETVETGSRAAAAGGFTSITALPNTRPVMDDARKVEYIRFLADRAGLVRVWPVGAVTKGSEGKELAEMGLMVLSGARAVTDDGRGLQEAGMVRKAMLRCAQLGVPLFEHCEDESLAGSGQLHEGVVSARLGLPGISVSSETVMLARDIILAQETGCRLHVMHVSCADSVEMIRRAKAQGIGVTAEVTPHHLLLTDEAAEGYNTMAKMKPPLRTEKDVQALREALADGTIDAVATDHAPHTAAEKNGEFITAPFGIVGLETAFPLLYTHLVEKGALTLSQLVDRMSCRPAAIFGIPHGTLRPGFAADITVIDTDREQTIDAGRFYSKGKNTPFHGWPVRGIPVMTIVAGNVIMRDGYVAKEINHS